jgi:AbrB family looped-hinge helix DNA binding protein
MTIISTVGRRGQITLPRAIRQWLNLQKGDRIVLARRGDDVILQPMQRTLMDLRGSVPVTGEQDFDVIRKQVIEAHARKTGFAETANLKIAPPNVPGTCEVPGM